MKALIIIVLGILTIFFPLGIWLLYRVLDSYMHISNGEEFVFVMTGFIGTMGLIIATVELAQKD